MGILDGVFWPFDEEPGWSLMAPCMRSCDHTLSFNGCDGSGCWCNKGNLDLRIASMTRCASSECTFANMNTQTDVDRFSSIQVQYCSDKGVMPAGMTLPSSVEAVPTATDAVFPTGTAASTGTRAILSPTSTRDPSQSLSTSTPLPSFPSQTSGPASSSNNGGGSLLSTAAKTGIGIGISACALLVFLIIILLVRRRKPAPVYYPPPPSYNTGLNGQAPPNMAPTPYSGHGPFSPPPLQHPIPTYGGQQVAAAAGNMGDVSPVSEKAVPVTSTPKVLRKEVGGGNKLSRKTTADGSVVDQTPLASPQAQHPLPASTREVNPHQAGMPLEVHGSVPPERHEVGNDGMITNTVSTRGMELDGQTVANQYPGGNELDGSTVVGGSQYGGSQYGGYQQSAQGYPQYGQGAHEVDGGQNGWGPRQELPATYGNDSTQGRSGAYGHPYELPGR